MRKIMQWFVPKEKQLFELLAKQSATVSDAANEFRIFVDEYSKFERNERKSKVYSIKKLDYATNEIAHNILHKLNKGFATSDKDDIKIIVLLLKDIAELISIALSRFIILSIERIEEHIIKLTELTNNTVNEVNKSIANLKNLKTTKEHCKNTHVLKRETDELYEEALSDLFHFYKNSIDIMKYRDIYELLYSIVKKCDDLADAIEYMINRHY